MNNLTVYRRLAEQLMLRMLFGSLILGVSVWVMISINL
jgi:hypothetical protein